MTIIDFNGIAIANAFTISDKSDIDMLRHMILNTIRMYHKKYRSAYGMTVIATDHRSWRSRVFAEYKGQRKVLKDDNDDWKVLYENLTLIREEIKENFPYPVINIPGCEADDIIGTLALTYGDSFPPEDIMIVSSDHDFFQLHDRNVHQFSPKKKKEITLTLAEAREYKKMHIIKGDSGDGIPNILSPDDVFMTEGTRQTPMTVKKIKEFLSKPLEEHTQEVQDRYARNETCIDLKKIPLDIQKSIIGEYESQMKSCHLNSKKILSFLIKKRCKMLIGSANDFSLRR